MAVYFVQENRKNGLIKIGHSSNVGKRMSQLKNGRTTGLTLLGTFDGGAIEEAKIHDLFDSDRVAGEWFKPSNKLLAFIALDSIEDVIGLAPEAQHLKNYHQYHHHEEGGYLPPLRRPHVESEKEIKNREFNRLVGRVWKAYGRCMGGTREMLRQFVQEIEGKYPPEPEQEDDMP